MVSINVLLPERKVALLAVGIVNIKSHLTISSGDDKIKSFLLAEGAVQRGRDYWNVTFDTTEDVMDRLLYALAEDVRKMGKNFRVVCYEC